MTIINKIPRPIFYFSLWVILTSLCFANFNMPFIWFSYVPMLVILHRISIRQIAFYGFIFSYIYYMLTLYWLIAFHEASVFFAFPIYSIYLTMAMIFIRYIGHKFPHFRAVSFPLIWCSIEIIRSIGFFGFRWNTPVDALWKQLTLMQSADFLGGWGVSFLVLLVNSCIAELIITHQNQTNPSWHDTLQKNKILLYITSFFFLCNLAYGVSSYTLWKGIIDTKLQKDRVALMQPNRAGHQYWNSNGANLSKQYLSMMRSLSNENLDLIAQSEITLSVYLWETINSSQVNYPQNIYLPEFIELAKELETPVLLTHFSANDQGQSFNSATLVTYSNEQYITNTYDKIHIVPFGEWLPGSEKIPTLRIILDSLGAAWASVGTKLAIFKSKSGALFAVLICFDDVYAILGRLFVERGAEYFVNATNDGWAYRWKLGSKAPLWQHLANTIHTAISLRRSIARAVNTGITAVVDPMGRLDVSPIPEYKDGVYSTTVPVMPHTHRSAYVRVGWFSPYLIFFSSILLLAICCVCDKKSLALKKIL